MITIDIPADLNAEDETGFVWTFLDEAPHPELVSPGALVVTGDDDAPAIAIVVEHVPHPRGTIVRLEVLPGAVERYLDLGRRLVTSA